MYCDDCKKRTDFSPMADKNMFRCNTCQTDIMVLKDIEAEMLDRDEIAAVQAERGNDYGEFIDHSGSVDDIMDILENINRKKNNGDLKYPRGFRTALFYIVSKLVRLATSPDHEDSSLDLGSYAKLWLDIVRKVK